jgi:hypothetical protein
MYLSVPQQWVDKMASDSKKASCECGYGMRWLKRAVVAADQFAIIVYFAMCKSGLGILG